MTSALWMILALTAGIAAGGPGVPEAAKSQPSAPRVVDGDYTVPAPIYSEAVRTSRYVTVRDGTRLAIDIYRPAVHGKPVETPLPVILAATPYHRADRFFGKLINFIGPSAPSQGSTLWEVFRRGYIIASLDIRGRGASFGTVYGGIPERDADHWDVYDVIEWLAVQPWCTGKVGMAGCSYLGRTQFFAADVMPPHLKAIAPGSAPIDGWGAQRVNGVNELSFVDRWDRWTKVLDIERPAPPVDEDPSGTLLKAAIAEHRLSWDRGLAARAPARAARPFRDSPPPRPEFAYDVSDEWNFLPNYEMSKIPVLQFAGWRDLYPEQALAWYRSLAREGVPQRIIIGPWYHCRWYKSTLVDADAEHIRWYDYWLKGVHNGAMDGPPVRYYVIGAPPGRAWRTAPSWPVPGETSAVYFLSGQTAGPARSKGGGTLVVRKEDVLSGGERYRMDDSITTSRLPTRWNPHLAAGAEPGLSPIDMAAVDSKSLTYTSGALESDVEMTGFPIVTLWAASTATDQDFFAYLEDVDQQGRSTLLTEGAIRASNRAVKDPPFDNQGLPWHASLMEDQEPLTPGVPVKLEFALYPTSNHLNKGHRLRLTVNLFDKGGWDTPDRKPVPEAVVFHDVEHRSSLTIPLIGR